MFLGGDTVNDFVEYSELYHHGIKGMRWGIRRYQNADGTLTPEGKRRYFNPDGSLTREGQKNLRNRFGVRGNNILRGIAGAAGAGYLVAKSRANKDWGKIYATNYKNSRNRAITDAWNAFIKGHNTSAVSGNIPLTKNQMYSILKFPKDNLKAAKYYVDTYDQGVKFYKDKMMKTNAKVLVPLIAAGAVAAGTAYAIYKNHKNKKRLEQNGKQYIELMRTGKMQANKSDSAVTKRVKNDYNNLTDKQFMGKYHGSKSTYLRRVNKYGDPYKNGVLPKIGTALSKMGFGRARINKQVSALNKKLSQESIKKNSQEMDYLKKIINQYKAEGRNDLEIAVRDGHYIIQNKDPKKRKVNLKGYKTVKI